MAQTLLYKYGTYTHDPGEILDFRWEAKPNVTRRGKRDTTLLRATLTGRFLACTWQELAQKQAALIDAYKISDRVFGLFHPDGTPSRSYMDPADPDLIAGPYLVDFSFPTGEGAEYVTKRDFQVVLEGIVLSPESQIIEFEETIDHIGTTGPTWAFQNTLDPSGPEAYQTWPWTTQLIIQRGKSVGLEGYYLPGWLSGYPTLGAPIIGPTYLQYEHMENRFERVKTPLTLDRGLVYYEAQWQYEYETKIQLFFVP